MTTNEDKLIFEGLVVESFPNGMFRVRLENEDVVLGYISGKIRRSFIRILVGDRVQVEVSRYDSSKGRIVSRFPININEINKSNNNNIEQ
uniref:Translational initiation factor n=1 Tax=Goeppertia makoyana TaxID=1162975 RepID=UPI002E76D43E|nr:Translational initiation factor [Goeppertia makoyana]WRI58258.1 Translational initiation factor [Goeppertia makoyana]